MGRDIRRETEENEEPGYYIDDIVGNIINSVDTSKITDRDGKLKRNLYNKISGDFTFINQGGGDEKTAYVEFDLDNAVTEWVIANIITGDNRVINFDHPRLANFTNLIFFVRNRMCFMSSIEEVFLESIKYLKPKKIYSGGKNRKLIAIKNPKTKQIIRVDKQAFKKIYGGIKLRHVEYKQLSTYEQIDYDIKNNCAKDFLTEYEKIDIDVISEILDRVVDNDEISTEELIKIYNHLDVPIVIYSATHDIIYKDKKEAKRIFKIYGDHLYVLATDIIKPKPRKRVITDISEINKYKNNKLYVTDKKLMDEIREEIDNETVMIGYTQTEIPYKTNIIIFNPYYETDKALLDDNNSSCRSVHNMIDNKLKLTGVMNEQTIKDFEESTKIRFKRSSVENDLLLDMNKAYMTQLLEENIHYAIPSINDYWETYGDDDKIQNGSFYYCTLNKYDSILAPSDDIYTYKAVKILQDEGRIKEIKFKFIPSTIRKIPTELIEWLKTLSMDRLRTYIGWLLKKRSVVKTHYKKSNNMDENDIEAIENYYCDEFTNRKEEIIISKVYTKHKSGILANMLIKEMSNIKLYEMNKIMHKMNPKIILNTIRTDSLGYRHNKKIKCPENMIDQIEKKPGFWKIEDKKQKVFGDYELLRECQEPKINELNINEHDEIDDVIMSNQGFIMCGNPGTGKTYSINDEIKPLLDKLSKKYTVLTITKDNAERIKCDTIASFFNGKSDYQIISDAKEYDYLIIDEAQLMDDEQCKFLDTLKNNTEIKFILIGDENQTKGTSIKSQKWEESKFMINLTDGNIITKKQSHRCDEKTMNLIEQLKTITIRDIIKFITDNFQQTNDDNFEHNLCKFVKTRANIQKNDRKCETIISSQGTTIKARYLIHDMKYLSKDQLITALSRSTRWQDIYFYNIA